MTSGSVTDFPADRQALDPIELLYAAADAGEDVYEAAVQFGMKAREDDDRSKWLIGDLAQFVRKAYGQNRIGEFAKAINAPVDRVKEYRTVSAFWTKAARADFLDYEALSYSHFRLAKRLKEFEDACDFLQDVAANAWTVEQARIELNELMGKPTPPMRLLDAEAWVYATDADSGRLVFDLERGVSSLPLEKLTPGLRVRLIVMEGDDE